MRIQDYMAKLSWTVADKALFIGYGLINILQNNALAPNELGLYGLFNALQTFIFTVSDGFILQSLITFGARAELRSVVNRFALVWHIALTLGLSLVVFVVQYPLAAVFNEPRITAVAVYVPLFCLIGIPRTYCLKFLNRDVQAKPIFIVNAVWFGSMTALTLWMLATQRLQRFEDMLLIAFTGMGLYSATILWITRKQFSFFRQRTINGVEQQSITHREMLSFGVYQGTAGLLGNAVKQLDVYAVQYFFGVTTVGVYLSAKTLFRFFDEAFNAIAGLVYPGTVRLVAEQQWESLVAFLSKMLSFSTIAMLFAVCMLEFGGTHLMITLLLSEKYAAAAGYFNMLILAAPALPFVALLTVFIAFGEVRLLLGCTVLAVAAAAGVMFAVGRTHAQTLAPLGLVTFYYVWGVVSFLFVRRKLHFPMRLLVRAVPDTLNFVRSVMRSRFPSLFRNSP